MMYPNLTFPEIENRPFFYTNFVASVDGKVQVFKNSKGYWPIGSEADHDTLIELRTYADILINGKNLAVEFGSISLNNANREDFQHQRKIRGKNPIMPYLIVTNNPDQKLIDAFKQTFDQKPILVIAENSVTPEGLETVFEVVKLGQDIVDLQLLAKYLLEKGYKNVLVEGGPTLLGSFLKERLMDEVFLTIAPKIFGNEDKQTITLVEGVLFPPDEIKYLKLISVHQVRDEIFLRYNVRNTTINY